MNYTGNIKVVLPVFSIHNYNHPFCGFRLFWSDKLTWLQSHDLPKQHDYHRFLPVISWRLLFTHWKWISKHTIELLELSQVRTPRYGISACPSNNIFTKGYIMKKNAILTHITMTGETAWKLTRSKDLSNVHVWTWLIKRFFLSVFLVFDQV